MVTCDQRIKKVIHILNKNRMTNIEKYNQAFIDSLDVKESELEGLAYKGVSTWDSVGQMSLIAAIEESFDIEFMPDDIMALNSYEIGKQILGEKYKIKF